MGIYKTKKLSPCEWVKHDKSSVETVPRRSNGPTPRKTTSSPSRVSIKRTLYTFVIPARKDYKSKKAKAALSSLPGWFPLKQAREPLSHDIEAYEI